jgi:restriction system protein
VGAWIVRAGKRGERDDWCLMNGLASGGFHEVGDLTAAGTREQVREAVKRSFPGASAASQADFTGQLWALRDTIAPGDLIVLPLKTTKKLALGICTGGYTYRGGEPDMDRRHTITVDWRRTDVSRAGIKDDLLHTLNGAMTVFQATKNDAEARLRAVLEHGTDPGRNGVLPASAAPDTAGEAVTVVDPVPVPTPEAISDRVRTYLIENFGPHRLTLLIADILRAEGYVCDVSPEGPDFGADIIAGRGPLGMDPPTLIVKVKAEASEIGAPVVQGLQGAMTSNKADQALLVAWAGLNRQARTAIGTERTSIRVWESDDVLEHLFRVYDRLPDETRAALPLKRAWVLDEEAG